MDSGKLKMIGFDMKRVLKFAVIAVIVFITAAAHGGEAGRWQADWERTVDLAKKEGQLTIYGSPEFEGLYGELHKKYPEIKITGVFNRGADVARRLMAERRGEKYLADLYLNGMTTGYNVFYKAKVLDPIPPQLVLPEVTDGSKWWRGKLQYVDPENQYLLNFNGENRMVVAFNTKLVNPAEIKSYWDLLNPKWKGKIVGYDPTQGGSGDAMRFFYHQKKSWPGIHPADFDRDRDCDQPRYAADGRLVGRRQICNLDLRPGVAHGFGPDADSRVAGGLVQAGTLERRNLHYRRFRRRGADQERAPSGGCKGRSKLAAVA